MKKMLAANNLSFSKDTKSIFMRVRQRIKKFMKMMHIGHCNFHSFIQFQYTHVPTYGSQPWPT